MKDKIPRIFTIFFLCFFLIVQSTLVIQSVTPTPTIRERLKDCFKTLQTSTKMESIRQNFLSITDEQYKFPVNDELTELNTTLPTDDKMAFIYEIDIPNYGYWSPLVEMSDWLWISTQLKIKGNRSIGGVRGGGNIFPFAQVFFFDSPFDASQWDFFRFWWWEDKECEPYLCFGLFDINLKLATYFWENITYYEWQSFEVDLKNLSDPNWIIDEGFNWTKIQGLLFGTDAFGEEYFTTASTLIDTPIFWREVPYGTIDFDENETEYTYVGVELIHAGPEWFENFDLYTIHTVVQNKGTEAGYWILPFVKILMVMSKEASEYLCTEAPQTGYYDYQTVMSYSIPGIPISFPVTLPQLQVDYTTWVENELTKIQWIVKDPWLNKFSLGRSVIKDKQRADFTVTIKVPARFKPYIKVIVETQWYGILYGEVFSLWERKKTEQLGWLIVDPLYASSIETEMPHFTQTPERVNAGAVIKEMKIRGCNFVTNPAFAFGDLGWILSGGAKITDSVSQIGDFSVSLPPPIGAIKQSLAPYRYADEIIFECTVYAPAKNQQIGITLEYQGGATTRTYTLTEGRNKIQFDSLPYHSKVTGIYITTVSTNTQSIYVEYVDIYQYKNFRRNEWLEIWLKISWYIPDKPLSISVEVTDSSGKKIDSWGLLASGYVKGDSWCGFGGAIISWAETGVAEVRAGLWTNWKEKDTADQYGWDLIQHFNIAG